MPENLTYDVVYVGNYTKDTIVSPQGIRFVDGGAINYAAHAGACLGYKVAVVTRLAQEDHDRVIPELEKLGVTCLTTITQHSTNMKLVYPTSDMDVRTIQVTSTAGSITAKEVRHLSTRAAMIGTSLRWEIDTQAIRTLRDKCKLLGGDAQGFIRVLEGQDLVFRPWDEMPYIMPFFDIFKADIKEAEYLTGTADLHRAAILLAGYGPREVLITHQEGMLVYADEKYFEHKFYSRNFRGRSGRGDTCTGAYVAKRLSAPPGEAAIWAAALTSLKMEDPGPYRGSLSDVARLIELKYR